MIFYPIGTAYPKLFGFGWGDGIHGNSHGSGYGWGNRDGSWLTNGNTYHFPNEYELMRDNYVGDDYYFSIGLGTMDDEGFGFGEETITRQDKLKWI